VTIRRRDWLIPEVRRWAPNDGLLIERAAWIKAGLRDLQFAPSVRFIVLGAGKK
jgi:hypothetical protein